MTEVQDPAVVEEAPIPKPASAKKRAVKSIIATAVLVAILWYVFRQFASAGDVWAAIKGLDAVSTALLLGVTLLYMYTLWVFKVVSMPGLKIRQAAVWNQATAAVSNAVPAGGAVAVGLTYGMLGSWGFAPSRTTLSVVVTGIWNNFAKLGLPIVAFLLVSFQAGHTASEKTLALIGFAILLAAIVLLALILRSEGLARGIGNGVGRLVSGLLGVFRRGPVTGWGDKAVEFRTSVIGIVSHRWHTLTLAVLASHLSLYVVLLASLRVMGVTNTQVGWADVLLAFTLSRLATMIKVTPGGAGVVELVLIASITYVGGVEASVVAAVFIYRFLTYVLTLPFGALSYVFWQRNTSWRDTAPPPPQWAVSPAA